MASPTSHRALVGLAHARQPDLSDREVLHLVRQAVARGVPGGLGVHVRPGARVVVKPNVTMWFSATDGVTTDPRVVAAVVQLCKEAGAGHVTVGDGSGGDVRSLRALEVTGIKRLALDAGADEVVGFEDLPQDHVPIEAGKELIELPVPRVVRRADAIINVPKAKTHFEDPISCCLKNWVGIVHQGARPRIMRDPLLGQVCAQLHLYVPAAVHVVDGLWAGQGNGPVANEPVWLGAVAAGRDPVAVDVTVARLLGIAPEELKFARHAAAAAVGERDPARILVEGPAVEDVAIHARPPQPGVDRFPARVLVGEGVDWAGTLGHFRSVADAFQKYGLWEPIVRLYGTPTFMIGAVEDPEFEAHVREGPYFVLDDAAHQKYREHPGVSFIPGHPATHNVFPHLFDRLHVPHAAPAAMALAKAWGQARNYFHLRGWRPEREEMRPGLDAPPAPSPPGDPAPTPSVSSASPVPHPPPAASPSRPPSLKDPNDAGDTRQDPPGGSEAGPGGTDRTGRGPPPRRAEPSS